MMTPDAISIRPDSGQPLSQVVNLFPRPAPSASSHRSCPPGTEKFLDSMTQKGLFGQEFIHLYFSNLYRRCLSKRTITNKCINI